MLKARLFTFQTLLVSIILTSSGVVGASNSICRDALLSSESIVVIPLTKSAPEFLDLRRFPGLERLVEKEILSQYGDRELKNAAAVGSVRSVNSELENYERLLKFNGLTHEFVANELSSFFGFLKVRFLEPRRVSFSGRVYDVSVASFIGIKEFNSLGLMRDERMFEVIDIKTNRVLHITGIDLALFLRTGLVLSEITTPLQILSFFDLI